MRRALTTRLCKSSAVASWIVQFLAVLAATGRTWTVCEATWSPPLAAGLQPDSRHSAAAKLAPPSHETWSSSPGTTRTLGYFEGSEATTVLLVLRVTVSGCACQAAPAAGAFRPISTDVAPSMGTWSGTEVPE